MSDALHTSARPIGTHGWAGRPGELSRRFGVRGVPHTVVNASGSFVGALPEAAFVDEVLRRAGAPSA